MRRFKVGDRVTVLDKPTLFHTRTQSYCRGRTGVIVALRPDDWVIPEDEAWGRVDGRRLPCYMIRFQQGDLWPDYRGPATDTVELEIFENWLEPAKEAAQ